MRTHDFTLSNSTVDGYLDSLALADSILGKLRHAMEAASIWDTSDVLISADHWYRSTTALTGRKPDHRVPFLLKLAGQNDGVLFAERFDTVLSADLVLDLLQNKVATRDQVIDWLDRKASNPAISVR